jgi:hypothetical protein
MAVYYKRKEQKCNVLLLTTNKNIGIFNVTSLRIAQIPVLMALSQVWCQVRCMKY